MASAAMVGHRLKKDVLRSFLNNAYRIWGTKYDYSIAELKHPNVPVKIICKQHGAFQVSPREHLHLQQGCPGCSSERRVRKKETQAALPPSPDLKDFMQQLSPGKSKLRQLEADRLPQLEPGRDTGESELRELDADRLPQVKSDRDKKLIE